MKTVRMKLLIQAFSLLEISVDSYENPPRIARLRIGVPLKLLCDAFVFPHLHKQPPQYRRTTSGA
jgi:hypothetical protein